MLGFGAIAEFAIAEMLTFAFRIGSIDLAISAMVLYELEMSAGRYDLLLEAQHQDLGLRAEPQHSLDTSARADTLSITAHE